MRCPHWKSYNNANTIQFFHYLLQLTDSYDLSSLSLSQEVNSFVPLIKELEQAFRKSRKSKYTSELVTLDKTRNRALRSIKKILDSYLLHFKTDQVKASKNIQILFKRYATHLRGLDYSSKSAIINKLCTQLLTHDSFKQDLRLLNLEEILEHLQETNDTFENTFLSRIKEAVQLKTFKKIKTELIARYRRFQEVLEASAYLEESSDYNSLIMKINHLVIKYNREAKPHTPSNQEEEKQTVSTQKDEVSSTLRNEGTPIVLQTKQLFPQKPPASPLYCLQASQNKEVNYNSLFTLQ